MNIVALLLLLLSPPPPPPPPPTPLELLFEVEKQYLVVQTKQRELVQIINGYKRILYHEPANAEGTQIRLNIVA